MGNPDEASASSASSPATAAVGVPATDPLQPLRPEVFHISGTRLSSEPAPGERALQLPSTPPHNAQRQASLENGSVATESSFVTDRTSSDSTSVQETARPREEATASGGSGTNDAAGAPATADDESRRAAHGLWSHDLFSVFASFFSIFGLFNVTRFSLLVYIYKACFMLQFFVLSAVFGVPFLYLQMSLGQYLGSGILDMWYISPAFKGVGLALMMVYMVCGVYLAIPVSWIFFYFRDSFIKARDAYRWSICQARFASAGCYKNNSSSPEFLGWTTASYFHGRVLDRRAVPQASGIGDLKFELAFNLGIIWLLVFIALSRGLKSFGKILAILGILSLCLLVFITIRMTEQWGGGITELFKADWKGVLSDTNSWVVAAREVFITWGLFGALALHVNSRNKFSSNITRNMICVTVLVCTVLVLVAMLFASVAHLLRTHGMILVSSSFEEESTVRFLQSVNGSWPPLDQSVPVNLLAGVLLQGPRKHNLLSGYQVARFAVEVFPAALSAEGGRSISPFWPICFFVMLASLGLGQQICIWNCIVDAVVYIRPKFFTKWKTIVTFITCTVGFLLGLFFATDATLHLMLFLDVWLGSLWWIVALYFIMLIVVLFIQGKPFGTDKLVKMIVQKERSKSLYLPLLTFHWNVLLPIAFLMLSIAFMRSGHLAMFSPESLSLFYHYWSPWVGSFCVLLQTLPLLGVALVAVIEGLKIVVFSKNQVQMHERIESWCCPTFITIAPATEAPPAAPEPSQGVSNVAFEEDVPPKYSPPPSYSTATARMILKELHKCQQQPTSTSGGRSSLLDRDKIRLSFSDLQFNLTSRSPPREDSSDA
ncbi:sodium-dependent transporter bedraggled [Rhipicephalus sanguineus]|uniref:sodium-dependent transporter bedraggled n=1 Tax=Rhipicephalus sanguineus TaxID=34632 RepID=UPI0018943F82|nr:sodium-dependent transporter bedraggled [Rhipicephalus sanguineus]